MAVDGCLSIRFLTFHVAYPSKPWHGTKTKEGGRVMAKRLHFLGLFIVLQLLFALPTVAEPPFSMAEVLTLTSLEEHLQKLKDGQIVTIGLSEVDSDTELKVLMSILVPAPLKDTMDALQHQANVNGVLMVEEIGAGLTGPALDVVFAKVSFDEDEIDEVKRLLKASPGAGFNFSPEEIALINRRSEVVEEAGLSNGEAVKAMSDAMGDILKNRYMAYRRSGLEGLDPYLINDNELAHPSQELSLATESLVMLRQGMPTYYQCLRYYPRECSPGLHHQFFWVKQLEGGRPMFSLKHWVLDIRPDHAVITERQFYLNHSFNSLQVVIGCLTHAEGTLVVLLNQAFTEKVNVGFGKAIATSIGRIQVEKKVRPMFEHLLAAFSKDK